MSRSMLAIIKKDIQGITANKRMLSVLFIVPLVLTIFIPSMFLLLTHFIPEQQAELTRLVEMLPVSVQGELPLRVLAELLLNYLMPPFFLLIPIMTSSVMSATSFVGEKEKRTLETLLYCPLSLGQIFRAKVCAAFFLSIAVSAVSFGVMLAVVEVESCLLGGSLAAPDWKWLLILLLVSPAVSLIAITLIVRFSAKAQSVEDAQQGAVSLILPVLFLFVGQFTGVLLISGWLLLGIGLVCAGLAAVLLRRAMGSFHYEKLLK